MLQPIPSQHLHSPLKINPPDSQRDMEYRTTFGEQRLEFPVLNERYHEEEEPDCEKEQPGEGIGGPDEELVMGSGTQQLCGDFGTVDESVGFLHVEHHQNPTGDGDQGVDDAHHRES